MARAREPAGWAMRMLARFTRVLGLQKSLAPHLSTGRRGERLAARYLRRGGYRVLQRNARLRAGEADILCVDPDGRTLVLVEVKTRRPRDAGRGASIRPEAAIGPDKARRLRRTLTEARARLGWNDRPARVDIVAIEFREGNRRASPVLRHVRAAVGGG